MSNEYRFPDDFEAWATKEGFIAVSYGIMGIAPVCHIANQAWQASAERSAARIAELEAEVVRLQNRLIDKGMTAEDKIRNVINNRNADAERFRWLEIHGQVRWSMDYQAVEVSFRFDEANYSLRALSEAIDEAMKGGA